MGRRKNAIPEVGKRMIRDAWSVHWWWDNKMFSLAVGVSGKEAEPAAEAVRRAISSAIAADVEFPAPYADAKAAIRYREMRYGKTSPATVPARSEDWLTDYAREIANECSKGWAEMSMVRLLALNDAFGGLVGLTHEEASKYLAGIAACRKIGTRNRFLATFSRFYKWAIRTKRTTINPFSGIKTLKEERSLDIVYCTPEERTEIIALAEATEWKDWVAVPIAFYSGMRREEVSRLEWQDVRFNEGLLTVRKSKTGRSRVIPLASSLEALLQNVPHHERHGHVVKIADGIDRLWRLENLVRTVQKAKQGKLMASWNITRPPPSRAKDYREKKKVFEEEKAKRAAALKSALDRIGWNPFRHTFGSLLAQAGVGIDKISAWMGNTPEVCRRHYAQFTPRDRRDSEIDKL